MENRTIKLNNDLVTGIKLIDSQHREFFALVNRILDSSVKSDDEQLIIKSFAFIKYYIGEHFSLEEAVMLEYEYPCYAVHRNSHVCFREEFERLESFLKSKVYQQDIVMKLNYLVVNWFMNHIKTDDKKLCTFLMAQSEEKKESLVSRLEQIIVPFFQEKEIG